MHKQALTLAFLATFAAGAAVPVDVATAASTTPTPLTDISQIKTIVVIYAENRSFDNLYGNFPGANGMQTSPPAEDRSSTATAAARDPAADLGGLTANGDPTPIITEATTGLRTRLFARRSAGLTSVSTTTHDLVHRFYENQMQIDGGKNDKFAAWADSGGLVMGNSNADSCRSGASRSNTRSPTTSSWARSVVRSSTTST